MTQDLDTWRPIRPAIRPRVVRAFGRGAAKSVMAASPAGVVDYSPAAQRRRIANGLPLARPASLTWTQRIIGNPYTWVVLGLTLCYLLAGFVIYRMVGKEIITEVHDVTTDLGVPAELSWARVNEGFLKVIKPASLTAGVLVLVFFLIDRIRPTKLAMKWVAFGWGATIAVLVSLIINSWAGNLMLAQGPVDPSQGARAAIFSAPLVEEAAKLTIVFWLAILLRRRLVAVHQVVTMAGLSAVGFAFVENIIYYVRVYLYAANLSGENPDKALNDVIILRGVLTCFGHPLFTCLASLGCLVCLVNRSKLVRVLAPIAGYLVAVSSHMLFNGFSSLGLDVKYLVVLGWAGVIGLALWLGFRYVHQKRNIQARLTDFIQLGWLNVDDPFVYTKILGRAKMLIVGFLSGPRVFCATRRMMNNITELAYLRDWETRGLIDAASLDRQRNLLLAIEQDRVWAITDFRGLAWIPDNIRDFWRRIKIRITPRRWRERNRNLMPAKRVPVGQTV